MAPSEIEGEHGLPRDIVTFTNELQQVIHDIGKQIIGNGIKTQSAPRYYCRVIQCVDIEEEESER